jgi:hypothetical protein
MSDKVKKAEKVYKEWHQKDPKRVTKKTRSLSEKMFKVGKAKEILYSSAKWEAKNHSYVHGPMSSFVYCEYAFGDEKASHNTSSLIGSIETVPLTHLGEVLEFTIELNDGTEHTFALSGKPMLCSTVDKKAIVILDRGGIIVARGGTMRVDSRGIID